MGGRRGVAGRRARAPGRERTHRGEQCPSKDAAVTVGVSSHPITEICSPTLGPGQCSGRGAGDRRGAAIPAVPSGFRLSGRILVTTPTSATGVEAAISDRRCPTSTSARCCPPARRCHPAGAGPWRPGFATHKITDAAIDRMAAIVQAQASGQGMDIPERLRIAREFDMEIECAGELLLDDLD